MKNAAMQVVMWVVIVALIIAGATFLVLYGSRPGQLDEFAQCLEAEGAEFYGAFWCPHCQEQKTLFGKSSTELPYVECSTPDGQNQTEACETMGIETYPTWVFADGTQETGVQSLQSLAEKTGCELPDLTDLNVTTPSNGNESDTSPAQSNGGTETEDDSIVNPPGSNESADDSEPQVTIETFNPTITIKDNGENGEGGEDEASDSADTSN